MICDGLGSAAGFAVAVALVPGFAVPLVVHDAVGVGAADALGLRLMYDDAT